MSFKMSFLIFLLTTLFVNAASLQLDVGAKSAVLINAKNGRILFEKNKDQPNYPASITKVATALYCIEKEEHNFDKPIKASFEALKVIDVKKMDTKEPSYLLESDGMTMNLRVGEKMPLSSLLHGLMIASANDSANVIAEYTSGSIPRFMDELNTYLSSLGCHNTHFITPHGLHHPDHKTSVYDMAMITAEAMKKPIFRKITSISKTIIPKTNKHDARELITSNRLINKSSPLFYPFSIGGKTGYTKLAQGTLVAVANKNGRELIAVLMGYTSKDQRFKDAKKLFEKAFAEDQIQQRIFRKSKSFSAKIPGGDRVLETSMNDDVVVEYYPAEKPDLKAFLQWDKLDLPIQKGEQVGELWLVTTQNEVVKKTPLFAKEKVGKTFFHTIGSFFDAIFSKEAKK